MVNNITLGYLTTKNSPSSLFVPHEISLVYLEEKKKKKKMRLCEVLYVFI